MWNAQLANRINAKLDVKIEPTAMFDYPSASALAEHITSLQRQVSFKAEILISPDFAFWTRDMAQDGRC